MADSFSKKEQSKKKAKQKQDKLQKMKDRKVNNLKGKPLEDMMAYIDENGQLSATPPDPKAAEEKTDAPQGPKPAADRFTRPNRGNDNRLK